ncbi:MAG: SPASM domain-containing protein [Pseudonocardiaceae bacterium]
MTETTVFSPASLRGSFRTDLPGRFNELDVLRREWPLFAASVAGQVLPPYEVLIHPSSGCNLRCQWCIGDHVPLEIWDSEREALTVLEASKEAPERLPDVLADPSTMMKLATELVGYRKTGTYRSGGAQHTAEFGVRNISFSGLIGEPLVARAALIPAIAYLLDHGMRVGLFTNGVLMDGPVIEVLVGAAYVNLSLDASTAGTYAHLKFRGHPAGRVKFERAVANLTALARRRHETGADLEVNVSFILYPGNHQEVYDAAVIAKRAGADRIRLKRDISGDRLLDAAQRAHATALISCIRDELVDETFDLVEIHKPDYLDGLERTFPVCSITDMVAAVGSDGCLYPCNYHPRPGGASYGSAIEASFAEVWEGEQRKRIRASLPGICPKVCDPFKQRANTMLFEAKQIIAARGLDHLEGDVLGLLGTGAYDVAHGHQAG